MGRKSLVIGITFLTVSIAAGDFIANALTGQGNEVERLTGRRPSKHPTSVMTFSRRLSAVSVTLALLAGNGAVCAGWAPTPEARMACCESESECPMHKSDSPGSHTQRVVTQAQADSCCAASERETSGPSNPSIALTISSAVLGPSIVLPADVPALVLTGARPNVGPVPLAHVPKHVLLSVFLV